MNTCEKTKAAILDLFYALNVVRRTPVSLYEVGHQALPKGFSEGELVEALYKMRDELLFQLIAANRLRLLRPPSSSREVQDGTIPSCMSRYAGQVWENSPRLHERFEIAPSSEPDEVQRSAPMCIGIGSSHVGVPRKPPDRRMLWGHTLSSTRWLSAVLKSPTLKI